MFRRLHSILIAALCCFCLSPAFSQNETALLKSTSKAFTTIAKQAIPAVVFIEAENSNAHSATSPDRPVFPYEFYDDDLLNRFFGFPGGPRQPNRRHAAAAGSGFFVSSDGYILTNNHIIDGFDKISVQLNNKKIYEAKVIGADPQTDLAILKIEEKNLPYLTLGDSNAMEIGEWVVAIGDPFGLQASLTVGVISAKGRSELNITDFDDFIQTDAAINPGNSGGPLLNLDGAVIGINTAILSGTGGYMGIGFAIPSNMAKTVMEQLIKTGTVTRGFLGVTLQPIDPNLAKALGLSSVEGGLINEVVKDSPADKAGLQQGDVIYQVNGQPVDGPAAVRNAISLSPPGTPIKFSINRNGTTLEKTIVIAARSGEAGNDEPLFQHFGITVEDLTPERAQQLGIDVTHGVLINSVKPKSPAAKAGLKQGAVILSVDRVSVDTVHQLQEKLKEAASKGNKQVLLLVKQGRMLRFLTLPMQP